jgi:hypothetical protein
VKGFKILASLFALAVVTLILLVWIGSSSAEELRQTLRTVGPTFLELAFLIGVGGALASWKTIRASIPGPGYLPLVVFFVALIVVETIPPQTHRIYYDEDIYENVAQNIVWLGRAQMCNQGVLSDGVFECRADEYNKEPNGFPFLLSLVFRITGVSEGAAHHLNHGVFALGALAVYWLAAMLFQKVRVAIGAATVYVLVPQSLLWAATVAAEPAASATGALALGAFVLFCRAPSWRTTLFAAGFLAFATQVRPESGLILGVAAAFVLLLHSKLLASPELYRLALLVFILLGPHFAHLWSVRGEGWGAGETGKFSWALAGHNLRTNLGYFIGGRDFPRYFTLLVLLGIVHLRRWRERLWVAIWFVAAFGIFIPFYAGSYRYGADVRFAFVSAAPMALLAGAGLGLLSSVLERYSTKRWVLAAPNLLAVYAFTAYLPLVRAVGTESWASRADHEIARQMIEELPENSILLTHNPGMIQVMGQSAAQASIATYQPALVDDYFRQFEGGVYFHYNFWCNVDDPVQNEFCTSVLKTYSTRVVLDRSERFYRYVLYRLLPKSQPPQ